MAEERKPPKPKTAPTGFPTDMKDKTVKPSGKTPQLDVLLAFRVKSAYVLERSRWETMRAGESVEYRAPKRWDGLQAVTVENSVTLEPARASEWYKLVTWCQERDIVPDEYVRVCFEALPMTLAAPEPPQLRSDKYLKRWTKRWVEMREQLEVDLHMQKEVARTEMTLQQTLYGRPAQQAYLLTLTSGELELSPLFRYCIAKSLSTPAMEKVATTFQAEAVLQFECYRELYKQTWITVLPDGFSRMSKKLYPFILQTLGMSAVTSTADSEE